MPRAPIRLFLGAALCLLPALHSASADTVVNAPPPFAPGFMTFLGERGPQQPMRLWREPGPQDRILLRRMRAPRTWREAQSPRKRLWRAEQPPRLACPAPIRPCATNSDCERRNPCVLAPRHSL